MDESSIPNVRYQPTPSPIQMKKQPKTNPELQKLRTQISGLQNNVEAIKVEPLQIAKSGGGVMGMDFRGSFNIKKNIVQK